MQNLTRSAPIVVATDNKVTPQGTFFDLSLLGRRPAWQRYLLLTRKLDELFGIDLRTLALTRVTVAFLLLVNLTWRLSDLKTFYTDRGVLPRATLYERFPNWWYLSLHTITGRTEIEALLFALSGVFAFTLLVGYRTRWSSFLSWLLFSSLNVRNPFVIQAADNLLTMLLFWGIFVPWGARFSVDSAMNPGHSKLPARLVSIGTVALLLQMPLVYFFGGMLKNDPAWRSEFTAIYYVLNAHDYVTPLGRWMLTWPGAVLKALTAGTLLIELAAPILFFSPIFTRGIRVIALIAFVALQLGFGLTMNLALFPLVSTAAILPFIPSAFWEKVLARLRTEERTRLRIYYDADCDFCKKGMRLIKTFLLLPETKAAQDDPSILADMLKHNSWVVIDRHGGRHFKFDAFVQIVRASPLLWPFASLMFLFKLPGNSIYEFVSNHRDIMTRLLAWMRYRRLPLPLAPVLTLICAVSLILVLMDNAGAIKRSPVRVPARLNGLVEILNVEQSWGMFAPHPPKYYPWFVAVGKLRDGREVDLFTGGPVIWEKPERATPWVKNFRWRVYVRHLRREKQEKLRPFFADYVCRSWNQSHVGGEIADEVTLYSMEQTITLDGSALEPEKTRLLSQRCSQ